MCKEVGHNDALLVKQGNFMLAPIILSNICDDGYYFSRSGLKVYTALIRHSNGNTSLILSAFNVENGEEIAYMAYFVNDMLMTYSFEQNPKLLPIDCPDIVNYEDIKTPPLEILSIENSYVSYLYKGELYNVTVSSVFDPDEYKYWAMLVLIIYAEFESQKSKLD